LYLVVYYERKKREIAFPMWAERWEIKKEVH